jgi:hypothetical protein
MTQYVIVETATGRVLGFVDQDEPPASLLDGNSAIENPNPVAHYPEPPSPTAALTWADGLAWVEQAPLADVIPQAISQIDGLAEVARMEVISRQTNMPEYVRAESQARAFKASGYPSDDVPPSVSSWADAKYRDGWTMQQAADDIIATADAWYGLLDAIRKLRLCAKEDVRHASTSDDVSARVQKFTTDLSNLMKGAA